jgi:group I intron endonuclease
VLFIFFVIIVLHFTRQNDYIGGDWMEVVCGIYCIENVVNHKKYVGQSIDVYRRWQDHKHELNGNRHHNIYLQRAWNQYGEDNFNFYMLETCERSILDSREIYYITMFNCANNEYGYNIECGGNTNKTMADETREKISISRLGRFCSGDNPKAHPVYCPQLDRWFSCIMDVQREGIACEASVRDCLERNHRTAGKHPVTGERLTWYDEDDMNDPLIRQQIEDERNGISHVPPHKRAIPLYCIELDRVFEGGAPQAEKEGIANAGALRTHLSGKNKSAGKHPITGEPLHWQKIKHNNT